MLLANITVAARITKAFPMFACLRRHPKPSRRQFDALLAAANSVGVKLDVSSSKALADSLDAAVLEDNPHFNKLLRILTTRCMTQAVYVRGRDRAVPCAVAVPLTHSRARCC